MGAGIPASSAGLVILAGVFAASTAIGLTQATNQRARAVVTNFFIPTSLSTTTAGLRIIQKVTADPVTLALSDRTTTSAAHTDLSTAAALSTSPAISAVLVEIDAAITAQGLS